jgi:hypothetical protein
VSAGDGPARGGGRLPAGRPWPGRPAVRAQIAASQAGSWVTSFSARATHRPSSTARPSRSAAAPSGGPRRGTGIGSIDFRRPPGSVHAGSTHRGRAGPSRRGLEPVIRKASRRPRRAANSAAESLISPTTPRPSPSWTGGSCTASAWSLAATKGAARPTARHHRPGAVPSVPATAAATPSRRARGTGPGDRRPGDVRWQNPREGPGAPSTPSIGACLLCSSPRSRSQWRPRPGRSWEQRRSS